MNATWCITTPWARYALRRHRTTDAAHLAWERRVIDHVRDRGVSAPTPIGETVTHDGQLWSLFEWLPGVHVERGHLTTTHAHAMGAALGEIHGALEDLEPPPPPSSRATPFDQMLERAGAVIEMLDDTRAATAARTWLAAFLDHHRHLGPVPPPDRGPSQVVHGDFQDTNVLFDTDTGAVVGVIDWDKAEARSPAEEVLRAMHLSFRLEPERCDALLAGYRLKRNLPDEVLDQGAVAYGYERDRSIWLVEERFIRGNERVDVLVEGVAFVPFAEQWSRIRCRSRPEPRLH